MYLEDKHVTVSGNLGIFTLTLLYVSSNIKQISNYNNVSKVLRFLE